MEEVLKENQFQATKFVLVFKVKEINKKNRILENKFNKIVQGCDVGYAIPQPINNIQKLF